MLTALFAGIGLCLSLIVAPGAQNVFLLREGIRHAGSGRRHAVALALVCLASDILLISVGVGGFGVVVEQLPWLYDLTLWLGVAFLAGYGLLAGWRAVRPRAEAIVLPNGDDPEQPVEISGAGGTATLAVPRVRTRTALAPAVITCLAITFLNPHTYLDTVLMLGSVSTGYGDARWGFAIGAMIGSALWFAFLTFAARFAARWLRSPRSWRVLDGVIAMIMLALAAGLAFA